MCRVSSRRLVLSSIALFVLSLCMRPPLTSVGALLPEIRTDLQLISWQASLLAAAPVLLFGIGAFISPYLANRFGISGSIFALTALLTASLAFRVTAGYELLMVGTIAIGLAIAVNNVLIPNFVRSEFSSKVPLATGAYAALFGISASVAAVIAVPTSDFFGGWRGALLLWLPIALAASIAWGLIARKSERQESDPAAYRDQRRVILRSKLGWAIILFFAFQSAGFYLVLNWLPTVLVDAGYSLADSGALLGLTTFIGVPFSLVASYFFTKLKSLASMALLVSMVTAFGYAALMAGPKFAILGCVLIGLGQATTFPLSLSFISTRANSQVQTTQLSTLSQGIGYLFAALCTFAAGALRDIAGNWQIALGLFFAVTLLQAIIGFVAGRPAKIGQ